MECFPLISVMFPLWDLEKRFCSQRSINSINIDSANLAVIVQNRPIFYPTVFFQYYAFTNMHIIVDYI